MEYVTPLAGMTTLQTLDLSGLADQILDLDLLDALVAAGLDIQL